MEECGANVINIGGDCDTENDESEEDDEIDRRRPRKKLLFDSDDEDGDGESVSVSKVSMEIPGGDVDNENMDKSENEDSDKENDETAATKFVSTKSRRKIKVLSDSESDEESIENKQRDVDIEPSELHSKFDVLKEKKNKQDKSESTTLESFNAAKNFYANSDLFDAEESSSDEDLELEKEKTAEDWEDNDEISLNDIKKKAKDTVTKSDRKSASGRRKPKKNDLKQLHSDSQRLLREGRVNLPYHVPQKKSLEDFLNRKKWTPNALKPRAHEIEHTLENIKKYVQENKAKLSNMDNPVVKAANDKENQENIVPDDCEMVDMTEEEQDSLLKLECKRVLEDLCDNVCKIVDVEITAAYVPIAPPQNMELPSNSDECLINLCKSRRALLEKRLTECTPKLGGCASTVICLDDDDEAEVSEFEEFLNRFVEHRAATTKMVVQPHQVELKILKKENDSAGETVLSTEKLIVTLKGDENPNHNGDAIDPGASRRLLKKNLEAQMAKRRAELRQKLSQVDLLDNEEGFEGDLSKKRESETEIFGGVETESEEDTEEETDESEEDTESEIEDDEIDRKRSKNVFVDDEAEEEDGDAEDEECEEDEILENGENEEEELDNPNKPETKSDLYARPLQPPKSQFMEVKKPEDVSLDTSIELIGSLIPANQPCARRDFYEKEAEEQVDNPENVFSQALHDISPTNRENIANSHNGLLSQFDFDSQLLSSCSKLGERNMLIDQEPPSTQEGIDELALLCSGKWAAPLTNQLVANDMQDLYRTPMTSLDNINELAGLCSGKFTKGMAGAVATCNDESQEMIDTHYGSIEKYHGIEHPEHSLDDELSISSLTSDVVRPRKVKRVLSDSENECNDFNESSDESQSDGSDVEDDGVPNGRISKFFDDEAELSGSDIPSDEDVEDEDDVLLEEMGDLEHFSEDELRDQDGKVHMKWMLDEDQRKLRHVKELYLENGDLHIDGQKRLRKFRWRNQSSSNDDNERIETPSETDECDDGDDLELRKCRNERQSWLNKEHRKLTTDENDEEMSFPSLAKKVTLFNRGDSMKKSENNGIAEKLDNGKQQFKTILCRGSFLSKNGKRLSKIADMTRSATEGPSGISNSRNFVFAARTPPKEQNPKVRRIATVPSSTLNVISKRHCLKAPDIKINNSEISVFNLL